MYLRQGMVRYARHQMMQSVIAQANRCPELAHNPRRRYVDAIEILLGNAEQSYWQGISEFQWVGNGETLVKTPLTAVQIVAFDRKLADLDVRRRYSVAGNVAWVALPQGDQVATLDKALKTMGFAGLAIRGAVSGPLLGIRTSEPFYRRVKQTLDPNGRFFSP